MKIRGETRRRGSDHGPRRAAGGRLWRCGTTRRRDRHGATVGRVRPNSRWPSCWRSPTRRRPNGSTRSSNGASSRRPRRIAGRWTPATSSVARVVGGGDGQRRAPDGGGALTCAGCWGAHLPAGLSGTAGDGGGGVPGPPDAVRHRRAAAAASGVSGLRGRRARPRETSRDRKRSASLPFDPTRIRRLGTFPRAERQEGAAGTAIARSAG